MPHREFCHSPCCRVRDRCWPMSTPGTLQEFHVDSSLFAESGELGYSLSHAYGSPPATSWHSDKFLSPTMGRCCRSFNLTDTINNPIILRISREKLIGLFTEYGYTPYSSTAIRSLRITRWSRSRSIAFWNQHEMRRIGRAMSRCLRAKTWPASSCRAGSSSQRPLLFPARCRQLCVLLNENKCVE